MDRVLLNDTIDLLLTLQEKDGTAYVISDTATVSVCLVDSHTGEAVSSVETIDQENDGNSWATGVIAGSVTMPSSVDSLPVRLSIEVQVKNGTIRRSWLSRPLYELVQDGITT